MKYQNFAIIFVIIMLPLSMVLSYYIQAQSETLNLETQYLNKLNDSTYDAIAAYQMNSLNTQRVTGESVKDYVLASVNTFFTTLATNLGMSSASKQYLLPYVPAILFTTYDGYYIYSPLKMEKIAEDPATGIGLQTEDGDIIYIHREAPKDFRALQADCDYIKEHISNGDDVEAAYPQRYTNNKENAKIDYNYMLKPFIYYSAQYRKNSNYDFVASYTLDNYVAIYGTINLGTSDSGIQGATNEISKSGYLIDPTKIELSGNILLKGVTRNPANADGITTSTSEPSENGRTTFTAVVKANSGTGITKDHVRYRSININSQEAYNFINYFGHGENSNDNGYYQGRITNTMPNAIRYQTGDDIIESTLDIEEQINSPDYPDMTVDNVNAHFLVSSGYSPITVKYNGIDIEDRNAKEYYIKAYFFSRWVLNNLSEVTAESIVQNEDTIMYDGTDEVRIEYMDFTGDTTKIFAINNTDNDPENTASNISDHKRAVIKNSIQFNLNTAISTYDKVHFGRATNEAFRLPVLRTEDWENILNNVSMTAFMQGMPCGLTTFNNYTVVKSNNNNTSASLENIYFTKSIGTESQSSSYYHKYDCKHLQDDDGVLSTSYYLSDLSAEFKYDAKKINARIKSTSESGSVICLFDDSTNTYYQIDDAKTSSNINVLAIGDPIPNDQIRSYNGPIYKQNGSGYWAIDGSVSGIDLTNLPNSSDVLYLYDHQNLGCYDCIVSGQYEPVVRYYDGELRRIYKTERGDCLIAIESGPNAGKFYYPDGGEYDGTLTPYPGTSGYLIDDVELQLRRKSIYTAIAKHRNLLYKTNDYVNR